MFDVSFYYITNISIRNPKLTVTHSLFHIINLIINMIVPIINIINLRYLYVILLVLIQLGVARADAEAEADPAACCRRVSGHLFIN